MTVHGKTCNYVSVPSDKFQAMAGEELTQMLAYFGEFGCEASTPKLPVAHLRVDC